MFPPHELVSIFLVSNVVAKSQKEIVLDPTLLKYNPGNGLLAQKKNSKHQEQPP
jgi:hypothetical protein